MHCTVIKLMQYDYELELKSPFPETLELYAHRAMRRVAEITPYESACTGVIQKVGSDQILVRITVRFRGGYFRAEDLAPDLRTALDRAECKIHKEIEDWRKQRFRDQVVDSYESVA